MRPLVAVRRAVPFDPHFLARDTLFWPLVRAARALDGFDDFPPVEALARVFEGEPPVRFVAAPPRRSRGAPVDARALYDARITLDGTVPTRPGCWHDFMNALVWGTFPCAKRALHRRQHRAITERLVPGESKLPPTRTPELDALALLDEGGVLLLSFDAEGTPVATARQPVVFGHAIYESLALGVAPAVVAALSVRVDPGEPHLVGALDRMLCLCIEDRAALRTPAELRRVRIGPGPTVASAFAP